MSEELIAAYDIRGTEENGLNVECAWNVGKAVADWLPTTGSVVVMGGDAVRPLADAAIEGLRLQGRDTIDGRAGDKEAVRQYVINGGLSGGILVGYDDLEQVNTIEIYQQDGKLVDSETGLHQIRDLVEAGNFVPSATKGELKALA